MNNIKEYLQKQVDKKKEEIRQAEQKRTDLEKRLEASNSIDEVKRFNTEARSLGETLVKLKDELDDAQKQLDSIDEPAPDQNEPGGEGSGARKLNPLATIRGKQFVNESGDDPYSTINYRKAFRNYIITGQMAQEYRATTTKTTDSNVGTVIPTNLVNRILEKFEQLGVIYNLVTHTSYPVGQTIPVDGIKPVATWVAEGASSTSQGKTLSASITFTHFKLRCEIRYTEEMNTMAIDAFETLFVKQVSDAMIRAIEGAIVDGDGTSKPKGILTETVPEGQALTVAAGATNKITYKLLCDAEGAIKPECEATTKWCMTKKTFMQFIGMTDSSGQPIARVNFGIAGKPERTLLGRDVVIYAPQSGSKLGNYQDAATTDIIFAFLVDFEDYVLNENYNLGIQHATDWDNEDHKTKAVLACDGKLITNDSLITLTKTKTA